MPVKEIITHYRIPNRKKNFQILQNAGFDTNSSYVDITYKQMIDLGLPVPKDAHVECICDYCGKEFSHIGYDIAKTIRKHDGKVTCRVCSNMHTCRKKYGRDFYINSNDFKEKSLETLQKHFGEQYTHPSHVPKVQEKSNETRIKNGNKPYNFGFKPKKKTRKQIVFENRIKKHAFTNMCLKKLKKIFGTFSVVLTWKDVYDTKKYHHHLQVPEIREKITLTVQENYGEEYTSISQVPEIKQKIVNSTKNHYGEQYTSTAQVPEVRAKQRKTLYENGTCPVSKQQEHICQLLNGKLNYPFKHFSLDIAFLEEKIDVEYDGGGHDLSVRIFHQTTKEEFDRKQQKRYFTLKNNGWKIIRLVAPRDKLLPDQTIIDVVNKSKSYLKSHHSIKIYMEEDKVSCSQFVCTIDEFLNMNFEGENNEITICKSKNKN